MIRTNHGIQIDERQIPRRLPDYRSTSV